MRMRLGTDFSNINYFGRGPWENYIDRNSSALISRYTDNVYEQQSLYVRPQENSYKTDIRWLMLFNEDGTGLLVAGDPVFSGSVLPYAMEDLDDGVQKDHRHIVKLSRDAHDAAQREELDEVTAIEEQLDEAVTELWDAERQRRL